MKKNKNIVKAVNRNIRSSPRKINILLKNIRGKKADVAIRDLSFARKRIAFDIKKTVQSAVANAENNHALDIDKLYKFMNTLASVNTAKLTVPNAVDGEETATVVLEDYLRTLVYDDYYTLTCTAREVFEA